MSCIGLSVKLLGTDKNGISSLLPYNHITIQPCNRTIQKKCGINNDIIELAFGSATTIFSPAYLLVSVLKGPCIEARSPPVPKPAFTEIAYFIVSKTIFVHQQLYKNHLTLDHVKTKVIILSSALKNNCYVKSQELETPSARRYNYCNDLLVYLIAYPCESCVVDFAQGGVPKCLTQQPWIREIVAAWIKCCLSQQSMRFHYKLLYLSLET